jgi:hypothetical protein
MHLRGNKLLLFGARSPGKSISFLVSKKSNAASTSVEKSIVVAVLKFPPDSKESDDPFASTISGNRMSFFFRIF